MIFAFYSLIVICMRALSFPKCCVVCCKKCGHDVLSGTDGFPATSISVVCSLCGERRRYLPSEVMHGRPHSIFRGRRTTPVTQRRGPMAVQVGSAYRMTAGRSR